MQKIEMLIRCIVCYMYFSVKIIRGDEVSIKVVDLEDHNL